MRIISPLLLILLLAGSISLAFAETGGRCKPICLMEQIPAFRQANQELLDSFYNNLPGYRKTVLQPVADIDFHREQFALDMSSPGFMNPETEFLRYLISDELFDYKATLSTLDLSQVRNDIKTYIPDHEIHRCKCDQKQNFRQLCK